MRQINKIIIHCAATYPSMDIGVREIRQWHTDPPPKGNGWQDIGYHFVIRRDGTVEDGRPLVLAGAHTVGQNANSIGVCLVGGLQDGTGGDANNDGIIDEQENKFRGKPEANFTPPQWDALIILAHRLVSQYPGATVHGHDEFANKACPTFNVHEWWAANS